MTYTALGENWEAAECYKEALERDPGNQEYICKLNEVEKLLQEEAAYVSMVLVFCKVSLVLYLVTNISISVH